MYIRYYVYIRFQTLSNAKSNTPKHTKSPLSSYPGYSEIVSQITKQQTLSNAKSKTPKVHLVHIHGPTLTGVDNRGRIYKITTIKKGIENTFSFHTQPNPPSNNADSQKTSPLKKK
ncbi:hypothetical protein V8G54_035242 [Vigna mungo]|uniref:Uncharacterized protein n=1 Tax=Vigna mungo TaxID=3915 RepID=A0AAQ3RE67_VIGMU